jgi:Porin subfamily
MKLKSLLLGSAAALVAFSGARAADAVIAEPEPVEYVRVCDAYGAGYFYIPGTETCLKIGGFVRYDIDVDSRAELFKKTTAVSVQLSAKSDTELGTLEGFMDLRQSFSSGYEKFVTDNSYSIYTNRSGGSIDSAYISLGGLKMGKFANAFDGGIVGEGDILGGNTGNTISYTFASGGFDATIGLDDGEVDSTPLTTATFSGADYIPNVSANAGFSAGAFAVRGFVAYDEEQGETALKLRVGADVTEGGRFEVAAVYATGATYSWSLSEWSIAAGYQQKVSDKVTVAVNAQYWSDRNFDAPLSPDRFDIGANLDWTPVTNFLVRAQAYYVMDDLNVDSLGKQKDYIEAKVRFQRSF